MRQTADTSGAPLLARTVLTALLSGMLAAAAFLYCVYMLSSGIAIAAVHRHSSAASSPSPAPGLDAALALHPHDHIHREPRSIHLTWNVTKETRAPDGVAKPIYLINGPSPALCGQASLRLDARR